MPPADVLAAAKKFFARRSPIYAAFLEKEGPSYLTFRGQGGEELVIGVTASDAGTIVRGSTYLFDQQIARFFSTLDPIPDTEKEIGMTDMTRRELRERAIRRIAAHDEGSSDSRGHARRRERSPFASRFPSAGTSRCSRPHPPRA